MGENSNNNNNNTITIRPLASTRLRQRKTVAPAPTPVSYQQKAAASQDTRYAQAIGERVQADAQKREQQLQQQQQQYTQQLQQTQGPTDKVNALLNKIRQNRATDADIAAYQKMMNFQYAGPQTAQLTANIAALNQLALDPRMAASIYGGFTPLSRGAIETPALVDAQRGGTLAAGAEKFRSLSSAAGASQAAIEAQIGAKQAQAARLREKAQAAVKAEKAQFIGGLSKEKQKVINERTSALNYLKRVLFGTTDRGLGPLNLDRLEKIGLTRENLSGLKGFNLGAIEGIKTTDRASLTALDAKIKQLENQKASQGAASLTPEENRLIEAYRQFEQKIERNVDLDTALGYAGPGNLARINALRALAGTPGETTPLTKAQLQEGLASGKIKEDELQSLKGIIEGYGSYGESQTEAEGNVESNQEALSGDTWYDSGLNQLKKDIKAHFLDFTRDIASPDKIIADYEGRLPTRTDPELYSLGYTRDELTTLDDRADQVNRIREDMLRAMEESGNTDNALYKKWKDKGFGRFKIAGIDLDLNATIKDMPKMERAYNASLFYKDILNTINDIQNSIASSQATLSGMSDIFRNII